MSQLDIKRILVLSPHPDDGLMGCGATLAKLKEQGAEITYIYFSFQDQGFNQKEMEGAQSIVGYDLIPYTDYVVRHFSSQRQLILEDLVKFREEYKPSIVFIPSSFDTHQDHQAIHQEAIRAFRNYTLLGYEESWNNIKFESRCFVPLKEKHIQQKMDIADNFKTQKGKIYMDTELIKARAMTRGTYIRKKYAEAFEVIRWIL